MFYIALKLEKNMKKTKLSKRMNDDALFSYFGKNAKYAQAGCFYYIFFNGKDLSADTLNDLYAKVKKEYANYIK